MKRLKGLEPSTSVMTVGAGLLMSLVDGENFPSVGSGLWWAAQTFTTVGYGDNVPTNLTGRVVAVLVMLLGIAFLTVITASITSTFVARLRREQTPPMPRLRRRSKSVNSTAGSNESKPISGASLNAPVRIRT